METKTKAAPWRASQMVMSRGAWSDLNPRPLHTRLDIVKQDDRVIAFVWSESEDGDDAETARKIAHRVNVHDDLTDALRLAAKTISLLAPDDRADPPLKVVLAAIAKAAGQPERGSAP